MHLEVKSREPCSKGSILGKDTSITKSQKQSRASVKDFPEIPKGEVTLALLYNARNSPQDHPAAGSHQRHDPEETEGQSGQPERKGRVIPGGLTCLSDEPEGPGVQDFLCLLGIIGIVKISDAGIQLPAQKN